MDTFDPDELRQEIPEQPGHRTWSRRAQRVASAAWPSFMTAAFGSMLFFAFIDPELLGVAMTPALEFSRMTGYALGFFFFWLLTALSSAITVYLRRTRRRRADYGNGRT